MTYKNYQGPPNLYFGITEPLPNVFTPSMPPRVLKSFRIRIRTNVTDAERSMLIRYQVYVRGFNTEINELRIPVIVGGDSGSNVGSDSGRSWAASAEMLAAALFTVSRAQGQALFRFAFAVCAGTRP